MRGYKNFEANPHPGSLRHLVEIGYTENAINENGFPEPTDHVGGTVAVSSVGTQKAPEARRLFLLGYKEMLARLKPEKIIFFGDVPEGCTGNIERHTSFHAGLAHAQEKR